MRNNLPVTQQAIALADGATLMSTTDLRSFVTYANEAFVQISGFSADELRGQPHNQVRHPDMPREAFADMWATLQAGLTWTALVKNRSKSGDHYWVRANATPVRQDGEVVGYMSVRTKPTDTEVRDAEQVYARCRQGRLPGRAFHRGVLVWTGWQRWRSWQQLMDTRARLACAVGLAVLPAALTTIWPASPRWATGLALSVGAAGAMAWLWRQIGQPLARVRAQAMAVAAGQMGQALSLNRVDDLGMLARSVNQAGLNLHALTDDVGEQARAIGGASADIAQGNADLSRRTEESAASLQATAAALEQLGATVHANVEGAHQAAALSQQASQTAQHGGQAVAELVRTMGGMAERSARMADIIGVIDGIAFQTNILALNAAVEAARAGEQGRGFAVVAGEVRALAQRSAGAAREIRDLIQDSVSGIHDSAERAREVGTTMDEVVARVGRVHAHVDDITAASTEQARGLASIAHAVASLDEMSQRNAAMVEQSAQAAEQLHFRTRRLVEAVHAYQGGATSL